MTRLVFSFLLALFSVAPSGAQSVGKILDGDLSALESELVPLAEAIPADKYGFAPTNGEFKGARTFGQQVSHVAAVIYMVSATALGEKNPSEPGPGENGPARLKTKDDIVKYLKDAFAYGHKATQSLTDRNLTDMMPSPFGGGKMSRLSAANIAVSHSFNHYGQMAIYARMNGIIPPASRR